ncbi:MAG: methyltransferase domain-containing protein [Anaerolineales bacterium]|nr:methyltransferase domain-containing protein [Anaerolineales bacterium]
MNKYVESNQQLWDQNTHVHVKSEFYDVAGFKAGKSSLNPIELEEIAGEVAGKDLLHLQCHFGMDTLSLARLGANATGVDFSGEAIKFARQLNEELEMDCQFIQSDIMDLKDNLTGQFDIVFTSYGVLIWLPDLKRWAEAIAHFLKPGGTFFIAEMHPFGYVFNDQPDGAVLQAHYPYFYDPEPLSFSTGGTYADREAEITHPVSYEWQHSMGEIINALIEAGLRIEYLHEFDYTVFQQFPFLEQRENHLYHLPEEMPSIPLLFSLRATKE